MPRGWIKQRSYNLSQEGKTLNGQVFSEENILQPHGKVTIPYFGMWRCTAWDASMFIPRCVLETYSASHSALPDIKNPWFLASLENLKVSPNVTRSAWLRLSERPTAGKRTAALLGTEPALCVDRRGVGSPSALSPRAVRPSALSPRAAGPSVLSLKDRRSSLQSRQSRGSTTGC